jgi:hypothetical protein
MLAAMTPTALLNTPLPVTTTMRPKPDLKPSLPPNFNSDRHRGKGFINACQAYFRLRPDQFPDEQTKIQWAMTYMNQGRAQKWVNHIYHWEGTPTNIRNPHFLDWIDFRSIQMPLQLTNWRELLTSKAKEQSTTTLMTSET